MSKINVITLSIVIVINISAFAQINVTTDWKLAKFQLATKWSKDVSPTNALPEYPRPQMVRGPLQVPPSVRVECWANLNGLWDYTITDSATSPPNHFDGQILVPYPIESSLSGVKKTVQPNQILWYKRIFIHPFKGQSGQVLLHFGAVDWQATVFVNKKQVGFHSGGYGNFSINITNALKKGENELLVCVYDPTDQGPNPHGKQVLNPKDIWYTPTTGIWQTVWLEVVPKTYIESLKITPNVDEGKVKVEVKVEKGSKDYLIETSTLVNNQQIASSRQTAQHNASFFAMTMAIPNGHLWSPDDPILYDLKVRLLYKGKVIDEVTSYFGMRKIETKKDIAGHDRIYVNNKYTFNLGVLDQGFWPDGIYTAPTDEALAYDIKAIKSMGFNTIRKHIKREPERWYYHCDRLGIMVWQDMVQPALPLTDNAKNQFEPVAKENIEELYNHPCITTWVLFNEKWGQYDQQRLSEWIKKLDPTRLLNGHSGEILYVNEKLRSPSPNAWVSSDITDIHSYPDPMNSPKFEGKARVLGEFGGIGVFIPDHQWNTNNAWGYINATPAALKGKYTIMTQHLKLLEKEGLTASIYTQPFDVEGEQNGLMTYDREVVKIPFKELQQIHSLLVPTPKNIEVVSAKNADLAEPTQVYANMMKEYLNGKRDAGFLKKLAMMAGQTNDAAGKNRFGEEYISKIKKPYSADDIAFMEGSTKKVTDPAFNFLLQRLNDINGKEQRSLQVKLMNIIYQDVIAAYVPNAQAKPDPSIR